MGSPTETANRTEKAVRILDLLDTTKVGQEGGVTADLIVNLSEETWAQLAKLDALQTGRSCRSISSETRAAVRALVEARSALPADAFAGLPS